MNISYDCHDYHQSKPMNIDLLKHQSMTVYLPDGTQLTIKHNRDECLVAHFDPKLDQILSYFIANQTSNDESHTEN